MRKNKFVLFLMLSFALAFSLGGGTAYANDVTQESYNGITPEPADLPADVEDAVMSNPDAPQESADGPEVDQQYFECDTGQKWTTSNGQTKMLDGSGNPAGPGENYLVIDVSQYQGNIDWQEVEDGGVDGVIIRATSYSGGDIHEDDYFAENIKGAMAVGLPVGVYVYSYAENASEALYEANVLLDILNDNNIEPSDLELGVYYDLEGNDYTRWMGPEEYEPIASTFINRLESYGYQTNIYSYTSYLNSNLDSKYLHSQTAWVAQYGPELTFENDYQQAGLYGWQYQSDGNIPGVNGECDVNCFWVNPTGYSPGVIKDYQVEGDRVGVLVDDKLYVKDNGLKSSWVKVTSGVSSFQLEGDRIAAQHGDGSLYVKDGSIHAPWVKVSSDVDEYQLEGNRIAIKNNNDSLFVKDGDLYADWVKVSSDVDDFQLEGNRIGITNNNDSFFVKEGSLHAPWVKLSSDVEDFQLEGKRVAIKNYNDSLFVKEGSLHAPWVKESSDVQDFQLEGNRIGITNNNDSLFVKEGSLYSTWVKESSDVKDFQLEGKRIGITNNNNSLFVKEGSLYAPWVKECSNVESFELEGNKIAYKNKNGTLYVKEGGLSAAWINMNVGLPL